MINRIVMKILGVSPKFDPHFYLLRNPDVADSGMDPEFHYAHFGMKEGRAPNEQIDRLWYSNGGPVPQKRPAAVNVPSGHGPVGVASVREDGV